MKTWACVHTEELAVFRGRGCALNVGGWVRSKALQTRANMAQCCCYTESRGIRRAAQSREDRNPVPMDVRDLVVRVSNSLRSSTDPDGRPETGAGLPQTGRQLSVSDCKRN